MMPNNTNILLVAEAYGYEEAIAKHPFVGAAGRELVRLLSETKLAPEIGVKFPTPPHLINYWSRLRDINGITVTNVFNAHPANNNILDFFTSRSEGDTTLPSLRVGTTVKYLKPHLRHHVETLHELISTTQPKLIIALGNIAMWGLINTTGIGELRGVVHDTKWGIPLIATYHPSAILRQYSLRVTAKADLNRARNILNNGVSKIPRWILTRPSLSEIENWFDQKAESYAIDIESGRALYTRAELKRMTGYMNRILNEQISLISFARDAQNAIVIPIMTRENEDLNYWRTPGDEIAAWKLIQRACASPIPKIFQNGMYDISILLRHKIIVHNAIHDTMLLSHSLYPELPKALGFLGSIYTDLGAWKTWYGSGEDLKQDS